MTLGQACKAGNVELVKKLLSEGADPNANNCKDNENALVRALNYKGDDIEEINAVVRALMEAGADPLSVCGRKKRSAM